MRKPLLISLLAAGTAIAALAQQPPAFTTPRPSPKATTIQQIGLTDMTIVYSRPGVKGRQVWGTLVPYGQVWRTGANEATTFAVSDDVKINGQVLPKGKYSLHTIPGKDEWILIFNKTADQWGSFSYDMAQDALRVKAKPETANFREWLTFDVPDVSTDSAKVVIRWEKVGVPFTVTTNTSEKVLASARVAVAAADAKDWRTPLRAATFALDSKNMADAQAWLDKSLAVEQNINNLYLKARFEAANGHKAEAVKAARAAIAKATDKDKEEVGEIEKSIATWQ
jgi:hypothetical protein